MEQILIEFKEVSVSFANNRKVLNKVSFKVGRGELISLIGANGSGKSTLLKTMVGMIKPDRGKVIRHTDNIFYVPQVNDLDASFPLSVAEFGKLYGGKKFKVLLKKMKMLRKQENRLSGLSGGEYQKVVMALALSREAELLLLDEPTSGIDVVGEKDFYRLISEVQKEYGISMIIVSHNIHMVLNNTNKVMCLSQGVCHIDKPTQIQDSEVFRDVFGEYLIPYIHKHEHVA